MLERILKKIGWGEKIEYGSYPWAVALLIFTNWTNCEAKAPRDNYLNQWQALVLKNKGKLRFQRCGCSQLSPSLVGRELLAEGRPGQLQLCVEVSLLWCQQDQAPSAVNWCQRPQPGLNQLPLCQQTSQVLGFEESRGCFVFRNLFWNSKASLKIRSWYILISQLYFSSREQKLCSCVKITLYTERALALKAVDWRVFKVHWKNWGS